MRSHALSRRSVQSLLIAALLGMVVYGCGISSAFAQNDGGDADALFRQLDTNKDGKLTMGDASDNNRRMLDQIFDASGKQRSGSVSRAEFQQVFERHRAGRGAQTPPRNEQGESELPPFMRQLDTNGDQKISRAELNRLSQLFDRLDVNKDGQLDAAELQADPRDAENPPAANAGERRPNPPRERPAGRNSSRENGSRTQRANKAGEGGKLVGVWRGWINGENQNDGHRMEIELTITADSITGRELGGRRPGGRPGGMENLGSGTYELTGDGKSGNLDSDGTSGQQDGRHFQGIYELDGDTLRWCVSNRGRQRPRTMASGQGNYLMVLQRQK